MRSLHDAALHWEGCESECVGCLVKVCVRGPAPTLAEPGPEQLQPDTAVCSHPHLRAELSDTQAVFAPHTQRLMGCIDWN